jgi:hypothetical protein
MLDIFALIVIFIIVALAIWLIITIARIPGDLAKKNNHMQVDAITTLAWLGVLTFGILWAVALVWAQMKSRPTSSDLALRVSKLEAALQIKESQK